MEYGLVSRINQYSDNHAQTIQKVLPSDESSSIVQKNDTKQVEREEFLKAADEVKETKRVEPSDISNYQEVTLTNLNFGFNDNSKDFFVRAVRGEAENQFPTDDMMRLKAYLIAQDKATQEVS